MKASSLKIFSRASQDVQSKQCGAVWLNGDAAYCQHLGRPLHGADAELERHDSLTTTEYTAVSCRWLQLLPYEEHREKKSSQAGVTHLRVRLGIY